MADDMQKLFDERLGRYQAVCALEPTDRIPIASGTNSFAEVYSGSTPFEIIYNPQKWLDAEMAFIRDFPEVDVLRNNRFWGPLFDVLDLKTYKLPGRDMEPKGQVQFIEDEYMMADEYDELIKNPGQFMMEKFIPRIFGESEKGSARSHFAMLKAGMAQGMFGDIMRNRSIQLQTQCGMPQPAGGVFQAPFDVLADGMRGLKGALMDCFRQPDKVLAACDMLAGISARLALSTADPLRRYPIFCPTHKPCFMSPKQFDTFYWPSFKKTIEILVASGYKVRAYMEGDWGRHWHHMLELPKGSVICDIDDQGDIYKAKESFGHHQCIAGGINSSMFILGSPQEMTEHVHKVCETLGKGGGFIINGGCNIPFTTKPENYRAMIDAIMKYGIYDKNIKHKPLPPLPVQAEIPGFDPQGMLTPWEVKKAELGGVLGDEDLIRKPWEKIEAAAYNWLWLWTQ